jgi:hypothetical protein
VKDEDQIRADERAKVIAEIRGLAEEYAPLLEAKFINEIADRLEPAK